MLSALKRIFKPDHTRSFDGAAGGHRWKDRPFFGNVNAEIMAASGTLRHRANHSFHNNPWTQNGVNALVSNLVGAGIRPASKHPDPVVRKAIMRLWAQWVTSADADGLTDFYGLQSVAVRSMITSGEGFAHDVKSTDARNNLFQLRLLDSEQVYVSDTRILDAGGQIISGVEFDAGGKRVAYWVYPKRQGQLFFTAPPVRIPASEVVHLFAPLAPGQVRGISWLSTILLRLHDLDQYEDAQLVRQKIAACFTAFIKVPDDELNGGSGATDNLPPDNGMEPGAVWALRPGEDVAFSAPPGVGDAVQFIQLQLRAVAAGIGIPEHLLTGDLSQVNYSSIRAGLIEFRRRIEQLQYSIVIFQFCRPVWERFVTGSIFSGALSAPDFESNPESYFAVDWYPPAHEWVDPLKDVQADALAVQNGFKPRRQVVAGAGYDVEEIDAEFVADRAREKALGLAFSSATTATLRESDNVPPGP